MADQNQIDASNKAVTEALAKKFNSPLTAATAVQIVVALSSIPDTADGMNIWVERKTDDGTGYFKRNQSFPVTTVTDPGAGFMFTENLQTERENLTSSAYQSQQGNYNLNINRSPSMDLLIAKVIHVFSTDTLNVTSNINVEIAYNVLLPGSPTIAMTSVTAYWRGMVVTGNGQVPELEFTPFLPTFDMTGFAATGNVNVLQPYIFRPILLPCSKQADINGNIIDNFLHINQTQLLNLKLITSNPNLRSDVRLVTGMSNDMVNFQKELIAFKANSVVASLPS